MSRRPGDASSAPTIGLAWGVADDRHRTNPFPLDRVEHLDRIETARRQGEDAPADQQVGQHVEQTGAVHQRGDRHVAGRSIGQAIGDDLQIGVLGKADLADVVDDLHQVVLMPHHPLRVARRPPGVLEEKIVAGSLPRFARRRRARRRLVGNRPVRARVGPSSTHSHVRTSGAKGRTAAHRSANAPWNTTASAVAMPSARRSICAHVVVRPP